jgi:hypothetical protein
MGMRGVDAVSPGQARHRDTSPVSSPVSSPVPTLLFVLSSVIAESRREPSYPIRNLSVPAFVRMISEVGRSANGVDILLSRFHRRSVTQPAGGRGPHQQTWHGTQCDGPGSRCPPGFHERILGYPVHGVSRPDIPSRDFPETSPAGTGFPDRVEKGPLKAEGYPGTGWSPVLSSLLFVNSPPV